MLIMSALLCLAKLCILAMVTWSLADVWNAAAVSSQTAGILRCCRHHHKLHSMLWVQAKTIDASLQQQEGLRHMLQRLKRPTASSP
jgi:hypothetical protein